MSADTPSPDPEETPLSSRTEQAARSLGIAPLCESGSPGEPLDLRTVTPEKWDDHESMPLMVPPDVAKYLDGHEGSLSRVEQDGIEDRVAAFYGIADPWTVSWQAGAFRLQRS